MLRIEKLSIQGFKSFCDSTEVIFDQEGITAVVGPNGCGKSNVADAISWVIGEQRAKALRGSKMEDVIFQGSRNRQPAGMAEVMLTMLVHETFEIRGEATAADAEKHATEIAQKAAQAVEQAEAYQSELQAELPVEGQELSNEAAGIIAEVSSQADESLEIVEEATQTQQVKKRRKTSATPGIRVFHEGERIVVGRRLYRTGESEYEMNGRSCRLRDVQDLFAGTGLGGAHYAIIEQGRIGQVLSAKPTDRRALIEEAAGISKFKMRQHAAELKLEASRQNLSRVTDILAEIERQQNSLRRQAGRARRYQKFRQEMRDLMRSVYVVDFRATTKLLEELEKALDGGSMRESEITASIAQFEAEQSVAAQSARASEEALNETRQLSADINIEVERSRQQQNYLNQQLQSLGARAQQFAKDQAVISERTQIIEQETLRLKTALQQIELEINVESKALAEAENDHRQQIDRDVEAEKRLDEARKKVYENGTAVDRWQQLKRQFTESLDKCKSRLTGLALERQRATAQAEAARQQHSELISAVEEMTERQQLITEELATKVSDLVFNRRTRDEKQTLLSGIQRELTAAEQRLKSLSQLDEQHSYFSEAVQALFSSKAKSQNFQTLGTLADFVKVAPEHESLLESSLREELQFVVVPSFDDALQAIEFLKSEGAGRATFLVINKLQGGLQVESSVSSSNAVLNTNSHLQNSAVAIGYQTLGSILGLRPEFAEAFKFALPSLANARIVNDASEALTASISQNGSAYATMMLARSGERVIGGRIITGGGGENRGIGVLTLKREINELTAKLGTLASEAEITEAELNEVKARIAELEEDQRRLDTEQRLLEKQLAVQREKLQQLAKETERTSTHIRVVEQETAQAEEEYADFEAKLFHATQQVAEAESVRAESEQQANAAQTDLAELRRATELRAQDLSTRRAEFAANTERRRGVSNDIRRLENESADLSSRLERSRFEAIEAQEQSSSMQSSLIEATERLQSLSAQQQLHAANLEERQATLTAARERLEALDSQLRQLRDASMLAREERAKKEIEKARLTSNLEHVVQACHAELGENIVEVCERLEQNRLTEDSSALLLQAEESQVQPASTSLSAPGLSVEQDNEADEDFALTDNFEVSFWQVPDDFDLEAAKTRLDELRAKIDALGPVNMMALQELTDIEERFEFLNAQKIDIEKAIADTQSAISEIKKRSRERFTETFHAVNANFKTMFVELFGGGQAEMRLIDETDVLESGIEIIAQPPGKRLQNVLLLSGGEKAMTAMALVLGIFKYRPSPFCLLDEVDAPLDETNIGRFSDKILEMSNNTQFMVITHSKRTMEAAKTLYGVTMEDPGISKLISVKLS
ncbi:MAG TPA: chromosome segregation protein SMC [Blastocatellia bacterium]|nr:chromosome segregation protein SMC [Blastocatellia bacterium]